jgi:trimeric autotransporter adhesin
MKSLAQIKTSIPLILLTLALACFGPSPAARAVIPAPDGCYVGFTTAEGCNALTFLTTGLGNTAVGWYSLFSNTDGSFNTAVGAGTLLFNSGDQSTGEGVSNTAIGTVALFSNTTGFQNTATGSQALFSNTIGDYNTANGIQALFSNTEGGDNTAVGDQALFSNTTGFVNVANGTAALFSNTTGSDNTANGYSALYSNTSGEFNTAIGSGALRNNVTGESNTAIGDSAGFNITGSGNVCIGAGLNGVAGENNITRIRNVYGSVATERAVYVTSDNRIGTLTSSRRYKDEIRSMEDASKAIHSLRPVRFRYKKEVDPTRSLCFGLIAEEVATIDPDLVTSDREGKPQSVRYEAVNAMLLNEFLKAHRKMEKQESRIEEQEAMIARQQKQIDALTMGLQKVTAHLAAASPSDGRLEASDAAPQTVLNNH